MLKLIGYEFRKSWFFKAIALGITALLELLYVVGLLTRDEGTIVTGAVLLSIAASVCVTGIGIISVVVLHRDMNTRQGYMLFMTPNSSFKILGAKVLENGLSILVSGAFFLVLGALDITLLFNHYNMLDELWQTLQRFMTMVVPELSLKSDVLILFLVSMLCSWVSTVVTACFADVMASSVLRGKKGGGFVAFLIFLLLSWLKGWAFSLVANAGWFRTAQTLFTVEAAADLVLAGVMYWLTALVMERKLSV